MKKIILGILTAVLIIGLGGCAITIFTAGKVVEEVDNSLKEEAKKVEDKDQLLQQMLDKAEPVESKNEYSHTVEFTLVNDTDETFDYIQLNADVFDANGTKLGNNMTNIIDVQPGQTFKLKLDLYQSDATTYKITKISSQAF